MIKIGIIGLGRIGKVHIKSISTKINTAKVIAAADPFLNDEMRSFAKEFGFKVEAIQGISTESEASAADIKKLSDFLVKTKIKAVTH